MTFMNILRIPINSGGRNAATSILRSTTNTTTTTSIINPLLIQKLQHQQLQQIRSMFIQTTPTPNEDALKFLPSQRILPESYGNRTLEFLNGREAHSSPLVRKLFAIDGIKSVMLGPDFLTVEKNPSDSSKGAGAAAAKKAGLSASEIGALSSGSGSSDTPDSPVPWRILKPEIFAVLTEHLSAGLPVVIPGTQVASDTQPHEDDDEVVAMIKELIDTRIRPAIQEDGGDIEYKGFTPEGIVQLKLQGACRSCDSSSVTLKNGIESMLMHYVEEVTGVEQVLDPGEEAALQEFEKFEEKLKAQKQQHEHGHDNTVQASSPPPPSL